MVFPAPAFTGLEGRRAAEFNDAGSTAGELSGEDLFGSARDAVEFRTGENLDGDGLGGDPLGRFEFDGEAARLRSGTEDYGDAGAGPAIGKDSVDGGSRFGGMADEILENL